ncbi:MAG: hypothetical protein JRG95_25060 [Deltaproteobacteria bacterium]|nr:hypothetical protein [Deltaproteobacteria bacterium]
MVDSRGESAFAEEPLPQLRRVQLLSQHLQGDATPGGELLSLVDGAHPAATEEPEQPVAAELEGEFRESGAGRRFVRRQRDGVGAAAAGLQGA